MRITDYLGIGGIVAARTCGPSRVVRCPPEIAGSIVAEMEPGERAFVHVSNIRLDRDGFMWVNMDGIAYASAEDDEDGEFCEVQRQGDGFAAWVLSGQRFYKNFDMQLPFALPVVRLFVV